MEHEIKMDVFRGDIREVEFRLDKEGKDFHHFEDFAKMYRAEVLKLNQPGTQCSLLYMTCINSHELY